MSEMIEYRRAVKQYRHSMNFARKHFALPLIPLLVGAWPTILNGIKIAGTLIMAFTLCKDLLTTIFGKVPHFFKRLMEYRQKSSDCAKTQAELEKATKKLMQVKASIAKLVKEVIPELRRIVDENAFLQNSNQYNLQAIAKSKGAKTAYDGLLAFIESEHFERILDGDDVITDTDKQEIMTQISSFMKEYGATDPNQETRGLLGEIILGFLPAAGYLAGGPQAVDALRAQALTTRAAAVPGSVAATGLGVAATGLSGATRLANAFFSLPMFVYMVGSTVAGGIANNALDSKIQNLCRTAVIGVKQTDSIEQKYMELQQGFFNLATALQSDIQTVQETTALDQTVTDDQKFKISTLLTKLNANIEETKKEFNTEISEIEAKNFSVVTEAAANIAKAGMTLLKDKTFDTAMLGMIAGMAIEKYRNKKEEKLANELLAEEAAKMRKFKM